MVDLLKTLLIGLASIGLVLVLLKWIEGRILARTDSSRSFEPFSMEEYRRSSGEGMDPLAAGASPEADTAVKPEKVDETSVRGDNADATCPCCGQPVRAGE